MISQDLNLRIDWDRDLYEYNFVKGIKISKNTIVWESYLDDTNMTLEYISFIPPTYTAFKMIKGSVPLSKFSGAWKFEKKNAITVATLTCSYEIKSGFGNALRKPLIQNKLKKNIKNRVEDLKDYLEG